MNTEMSENDESLSNLAFVCEYATTIRKSNIILGVAFIDHLRDNQEDKDQKIKKVIEMYKPAIKKIHRMTEAGVALDDMASSVLRNYALLHEAINDLEQCRASLQLLIYHAKNKVIKEDARVILDTISA